MDPVSFANFLGYKGTLLEIFSKSIELAKRAPYDSNAFEELQEIAVKCRKRIGEKYNYNHNGLEKFIQKNKSYYKMDLLKYKPNKSNLEYYLDKNNSKK